MIGTYNSKVGPLKNPHDDIALVGAALRSLGFTVTEVTDADYRSMDVAIKRHAATVRREGVGTISLLYYSGHGAADPDTKTNYLIPVDIAEADDADPWNASLNLTNVVEGLRAQAPAATHYVIFDACRNELNLMRKGSKAITAKGFVPIAYLLATGSPTPRRRGRRRQILGAVVDHTLRRRRKNWSSRASRRRKAVESILAQPVLLAAPSGGVRPMQR